MKVLLTGATGYIGRRLKAKLLQEKDVKLRLFTRNIKSLSPTITQRAEVVQGDTFDKDS